MDLPEGFREGDQAMALADRLREGIGDLGAQVLQRVADCAAKPAGAELALPGRLVHRYDATDLQRLRDLRSAFLPFGFTEDFKLRLDDLQAAPLVLFDLAVERNQLSGLETALKIAPVEPEAFEPGAAEAAGPSPGMGAAKAGPLVRAVVRAIRRGSGALAATAEAGTP